MSIKNPEQELKDLAYVWLGVVDRTLEESFDRRLYQVKYPDVLRLLSLRTWTIKYSLPLEEILKVLLDYYKRFERKFRRPSSGGKSLGCRISNLCGDRSEELLQEYIVKTYPSNEHVSVYKAQQQARYLKVREIKVFYSKTVEMFLKRYKRTTEEARKANQKILTKGELRKRRYPDSPWI